MKVRIESSNSAVTIEALEPGPKAKGIRWQLTRDQVQMLAGILKMAAQSDSFSMEYESSEHKA